MFISGVNKRNFLEVPRNSYKHIKTDSFSYEGFVKNLGSQLLNNVKNYQKNSDEVVNLASQLIVSTNKVGRLKKKLSSLQSSLNSTMCQQFNTTTPEFEHPSPNSISLNGPSGNNFCNDSKKTVLPTTPTLDVFHNFSLKSAKPIQTISILRKKLIQLKTQLRTKNLSNS